MALDSDWGSLDVTHRMNISEKGNFLGSESPKQGNGRGAMAGNQRMDRPLNALRLQASFALQEGTLLKCLLDFPTVQVMQRKVCPRLCDDPEE